LDYFQEKIRNKRKAPAIKGFKNKESLPIISNLLDIMNPDKGASLDLSAAIDGSCSFHVYFVARN